mmetsp:Transcript_35096/g.73096  ORF Transcript_35096/g.73096 Transcript_35096/m.73096 type:complete len:182 (-) Transcript_35096:749-1294(-)
MVSLYCIEQRKCRNHSQVIARLILSTASKLVGGYFNLLILFMDHIVLVYVCIRVALLIYCKGPCWFLTTLLLASFSVILLPPTGAIVLLVLGLVALSHIASTYSAMGQVIMATSAMSSEPILPTDEEEKLTPGELYHVLLHETMLAKKAEVPINKQYRMDYRQHLHDQQVSRRRRQQPFNV